MGPKKEQAKRHIVQPEADAAVASDGTESDDYDSDEYAAIIAARKAASYDDDSDDSDEGDNDIPMGADGAPADAGHSMFDFNFFDPAEIDFHSVKRLLRRYLASEVDTFDSSGMSDAIVCQPEVGTTVKVPGDDDVYSFATVLDIESFMVSLLSLALSVPLFDWQRIFVLSITPPILSTQKNSFMT